MSGPRVIRPGPASIPPGEVPGGVLIHVYDGHGTLLGVDPIGPGADVEARADLAADVAFTYYGATTVVLVAYDGDTGQRFTADDWTAP